MYKVSRAFKDGSRLLVAAVVPVENLRRSIVLFPDFGPSTPRNWAPDNVLELCNTFYVNPFSDDHAYRTIY